MCRGPPGRGGGSFFGVFFGFVGGRTSLTLVSDCMWDFSSLNFGILNTSDLASVNLRPLVL